MPSIARKYLAALVLPLVLVAGIACTPEEEKQVTEILLSPTAAAATATAAPKAAATTAATATAAAAAVTGTAKLGWDHPPYPAGNNFPAGGLSTGIFCGRITGAPPNSILSLNLSGAAVTGAPMTAQGPIGADGAFIIPFPINSMSPVTATVSGIRTPAGQALTLPSNVISANSTVTAADFACVP